MTSSTQSYKISDIVYFHEKNVRSELMNGFDMSGLNVTVITASAVRTLL